MMRAEFNHSITPHNRLTRPHDDQADTTAGTCQLIDFASRVPALDNLPNRTMSGMRSSLEAGGRVGK